MMEKWHNKVAVVTGASAGIGLACCKALIDNGLIVVGLARRQHLIDQLRNEWPNDKEKQMRLHAIKCDVTNEETVCTVFKQIADKFGTINILINNAGLVRDTKLLSGNNSTDIRDTIETNVMGVAYCTREAFRYMSQDPANSLGYVILINSYAGHRVPFSMNGGSLNIYAASKHAVTAMNEVYRQELLQYKANIKVTSISPGAVRTDIFSEGMRQRMVDYPFLEASDISDAVIYCLQTPPHVQIHEMIIKPVGELF